MSHKATSWLASLDPSLMKSSEFRVLFHLCDCHNPSQGCFPSQEYLRTNSGISNGTLNNALNVLEGKALIARHQSRHGKTKRQMPTRYMLAFELEMAEKPSPETGVGSVSKKTAKPSPVYGKSRLQPTGEKPVKKPVNNRARETSIAARAEFWAKKINDGAYVSPSAINCRLAQFMIEEKLVEAVELKKRGIAY